MPDAKNHKPREVATGQLAPWRLWLSLWSVFVIVALLEAPHLYRDIAQRRILRGRTIWLPLTRLNLDISDTLGLWKIGRALDHATAWLEHSPVLFRRNAYAFAEKRRRDRKRPSPKPRQLLARTTGHVSATKKPKPRAHDKRAPRRVLLVGASSIALHLGVALERELERHGLSVYRYGKIATGLVRIDHFDWYAKLDELDKRFKSDLVIGQFGANDCQVFVFKRRIVRVFTPKWRELFAKRLRRMVKKMQRDGRAAVLIGVQNMRSKRFARRIKKLNAIMKHECETMGCIFIPTWDLTSDAKGRYVATAKVGKWRGLMRQQDGIHFTSHGARFMAPRLVKRLRAHFTLPPKQPQ